jgi:hypothetical protein
MRDIKEKVKCPIPAATHPSCKKKEADDNLPLTS